MEPLEVIYLDFYEILSKSTVKISVPLEQGNKIIYPSEITKRETRIR